MESIQDLIEELSSPDGVSRERAARALEDRGDSARVSVPALLRTLIRETDACPGVGSAIVSLVPSTADLSALRQALESSNDHSRFWAARAVVKMGPEAAPLVDDLIGLLCDSHSTVVDSVTWALGMIGRQAIPPLIDAAHSSNAQLRARAVLALGRYPEYIEAKLPTILAALNDSQDEVRLSAGRAVCYLGQTARDDHAIYPAESLDQIRDALDRISQDPSIAVGPEWLQRVRDWLRSGET